ncbi:uncharacterized protein LOC132587741 [Heteronotia binoei]|uniref:uncharacterized protein LOC132587741 n=1 Tax=Heteronotia binoei TaxID=13085 RepID=UPI00292F0CDB|nr:uncharacterized protein LOC132587741 [Heteronotia binoei]
MGRRRRLLLLWALLGLLHPGAPRAQSVQHTYENVKVLQISMRPTAAVQISSNTEESPKDQDNSQSEEEAEAKEKAEAKEEEKTLHDLVGVLQDMVQDIPTVKAQHPIHTILLPTIALPTEPPAVVTTVLEPPVVMTTAPEPSQPEMVHTVEVSLSPTPKEESETSETVVVTNPITPASPAHVIEIKNATGEPVLLHIDQTTREEPLVSVSLVLEKTTTKKSVKNFDQLTNGALSNLEQSLENVKKLNGILDTFTKKAEHPESKAGKAPKEKPAAGDILGLIANLIETLKSTPSFVKEDRNLYKYIQTAETYIKEALELTEKAEKKLQEEHPVLPSTPPPAREEEILLPPTPAPEPLPAPTIIVHPVSPPPEPLAEKAEDAQEEMGKLKAFINLLYGFSPHLTSFTKNTAHKKVAEDIVERALGVLHAIKSVFCNSQEAQSKRALKQLLKEDMELMNQAMKAKGKRVH